MNLLGVNLKKFFLGTKWCDETYMDTALKEFPAPGRILGEKEDIEKKNKIKFYVTNKCVCINQISIITYYHMKYIS